MPTRAKHAPRLVKGARYRLLGKVYRCILVNNCRARLELCGGEKVTRKFQARGEDVEFETWEGRRFLDVSPYSILERVNEEED